MSSRSLLSRLRLRGGQGALLLSQAAAFVVAIAALVLWLSFLGYPTDLVVQALWDGAVAAPGSLDVALGHAVPLMLTAAAVWLAYQSGLFNVGPDGQLQLAGIATVALVTALPADTPGVLLIALGLIAGILVGGALGMFAVVLKLWRGASEVITTLMTVFIAMNLVNVLIAGPLRRPEAKLTAESERIPAAAELGSFLGTPITWGILIAVAATALVLVLVLATTAGLRLRAVGLNENAALRSGIAVSRMQFAAFAASGALSGLAGALVILGLRYQVSPGWAPLWGFGGILIAFIALRTPALIPVWAVLFGMLTAAGPTLKGTASVPDAIVVLTQTLPVIALFLIEAGRRAWLKRRERQAEPALTPPPTPAAATSEGGS